jgi:hypothetical protein
MELRERSMETRGNESEEDRAEVDTDEREEADTVAACTNNGQEGGAATMARGKPATTARMPHRLTAAAQKAKS